nr:MAG TPA: hypothetical protein [Caudoviricetes sp.]
MYFSTFYPPGISLCLIISKFPTCGDKRPIKLLFSVLYTKTLSL